MSRMLIEIAACLLAAGVLGLLAGWMASRATSRRRHRASRVEWQRRYQELELQSGREIDQLETQVQDLAEEVRKLNSSNRSLEDSLKKTEAGIHQARTEAIELNRQQASTQERLQKLLKQKDDEITQLQNGDTATRSLETAAAMTGASMESVRRVSELRSGQSELTPEIVKTREAMDILRERRSALDAEANALDDAELSQQTVAIDHSDLPSELFDKTVRMDPDNLQPVKTEVSEPLIDATVAIDADSDATIALDADSDVNDATILIEPPFADTEEHSTQAADAHDQTDTVVEAIDTDGTEKLPH